MVHTRPTTGAIFRINWWFLWAYFWGWLTFVSWSLTAFHWGFGAIPILCGLISWALLRSNLRSIAHHLRRDGEVRKFNRHGTAPRSDRMATRNVLRKGGLLR